MRDAFRDATKSYRAQGALLSMWPRVSLPSIAEFHRRASLVQHQTRRAGSMLDSNETGLPFVVISCRVSPRLVMLYRCVPDFSPRRVRMNNTWFEYLLVLSK